MRKYQHIFWDLDHTLWDFESNSVSSLKYVYEYYKLNAEGVANFEDFNIVYHEINDKLWDRFRKGFISRTEMRWKRMYKTLLHYKVTNEALARDMGELYLEVLPQQKKLMPAAREVLVYCQQNGYKQHMITNGFEATQWQKMRNADIDKFFEYVITSEEAMALKPDKEIYEFACKQTGALPGNSIMIGDAIDVDVKGALDFGMDGVWYNPQRQSSTSPRTYEVQHLSELNDILA